MHYERNELGLEPQALKILDRFLEDRILSHEEIFNCLGRNTEIYKSTTIDKRGTVRVNQINKAIKDYGIKLVSIYGFGYELIIDKYR
jgi:DNA-binding response OmpR family regulator